jgi:hypothetical protein
LKALTICQPYASLIAVGAKCIETRSWKTPVRGTIAIHASLGKDYLQLLGESGHHGVQHFAKPLRAAGYENAVDLPRGGIVAVADIVDCQLITEDTEVDFPEFYFGDYTLGRYAWHLANIRCLTYPIPCKGALGLWTVPEDVARTVAALLGLEGMPDA